MTDIVERLRDWAEYDEGKINDARECAADEIERLRYSLGMILDDLEASAKIGYVPDSLLLDHIYVTARKLVMKEDV